MTSTEAVASAATDRLATKFGNDKFVNAVMGVTLVIVFVAMLAANVAASIVLYNKIAIFGVNVLPAQLGINSLFANFRGAPSIFGGPVAQILPGLIAALCFRRTRPILSRLGRCVLLLDAGLLIVSGLGLSIAPPSNVAQNFPGGAGGYEQFHGIVQASFSLAWVYLGMLTGLSIKLPESDANAGGGSQTASQPSNKASLTSESNAQENPSGDVSKDKVAGEFIVEDKGSVTREAAKPDKPRSRPRAKSVVREAANRGGS